MDSFYQGGAPFEISGMRFRQNGEQAIKASHFLRFEAACVSVLIKRSDQSDKIESEIV